MRGEPSTNYDLAIIGSGPGGYVAALYASRHKLKTCVIENGSIGGTCLNKGCIPTKVMLSCASLFQSIRDSASRGIEVDGCRVNFQKIISRRDEVVLKLRTGIETLFRANKIDLVKGRAHLAGPSTIRVEGACDVNAKSIIIATGSKVSSPPNIPVDETSVLSSDGILAITKIPVSLAIIGGGIIGCEFAALFNALGSKVTIVELCDRLILTQSKEASKKLELLFRKKGVEVLTSSTVQGLSAGDPLKISIAGGRSIEAEKVLVSVGRRPNGDEIGIEKFGAKVVNGRIEVDKYLRTGALENIYAIGDCVEGPLLAHKASYDGMVACDNILGIPRQVDYSNIPSCIYTEPEIASVGMSEDEARVKIPDAKIAKFPYLASGKAYLMGVSEGFIKIVGDSNGKLLGAEIFGEGACDLIGELVMAKTFGINIKDLSHVVHGHPTLSEIIQEAAHIFCGTGIHSV